MNHIPFQLELVPDLPIIVGNKDYNDFRKLLERVDELLIFSGIEDLAVQSVLISHFKTGNNVEEFLSAGGNTSTKKVRLKRQIVKALRCNLARQLTGDSFRAFALHLADSVLLQKFCGLVNIEKTSIPGKSTLENYSKCFSEEQIRGWLMELHKQVSSDKGSKGKFHNLERPLDMFEIYFDTTCLRANIHFPVDWVLLKDGVITLMRAVVLIRKQGLKNRMDDPKRFIKAINKLSIEMTHCRRVKDSKKKRKKVLRKMKRLCKIITNHALVHKGLLEGQWKDTKYSKKQAEQILNRINGVLEKLPEAIKQAHERIIGERQVPSKDKILSLYEPDVHVIVRGKAGAEVEFGNTLLLAEQKDGLILDWKLLRGVSKGDPSLMRDSLERLKQYEGTKPGVVIGDRGFWSKKNEKLLQNRNIRNAVCPRNIVELTEKLKDKEFVRLQNRRAQTEGRIGILKNKFLRNPNKSKGFKYQEINLAWAVFTHNFWVLARLPKADEKENDLLWAA